jgi:MFS family permease
VNSHDISNSHAQLEHDAGGGGIITIVLIIITEITPPSTRPKYQALTGAFLVLGSILGPLLGGILSDSVIGWRSCFYGNIPICLFCIIISWVCLTIPSPTGSLTKKFAEVDYLGCLMVCILAFVVLTPLQMGGSVWEWHSVPIILLFVLSVPLFLLLMYIESRIARNPIIDFSLFKDLSVISILAIGPCSQATMMSMLFLVSLIFVVGYGDTATQAGIAALPLVFGLMIMIILSGVVISKSRKSSFSLLPS